MRPLAQMIVGFGCWMEDAGDRVIEFGLAWASRIETRAETKRRVGSVPLEGVQSGSNGYTSDELGYASPELGYRDGL